MKSIYDEHWRIRQDLVKPCPFCGRNDKLVIRSERDMYTCEEMFNVECINCSGAMTAPSKTERGAIRRWNRRSE